MSVRVMSWVFEHSKSTGNARLVLLAIADRCDDDGGNCWKSTETLAAKAKVSKRTAQRCIDQLIELGELHAVERLGLTSVLSVVMDGRQVVAPAEIPPAETGGVKLSPVPDRRRVTPVTRGASPVTPDTSLSHPRSPQPPASGGRFAHCDKHSKYRRSCSRCDEAAAEAKARPPWCGMCHEETRQLEDDDGFPAGRCPECHPIEVSRRTA